MFNFFKRRAASCRHQPISKYDRWEHSPSGQGFWVSECQECGVEMTQAGGGKWQAVPMADRR